MTNDVYWVLRLAINDGQEDAFEALMPEMVEATLEDIEARMAYNESDRLY